MTPMLKVLAFSNMPKIIFEEETGYEYVSSVDWYKVYERLAIRFKEQLARLRSKTNNIHDTKNEVLR